MDPAREAPFSLDQWLNAYTVEFTPEEHDLVRNAAKQLQSSTAFKRVMATMEARTVRAMVQIPADQVDQLHQFKLQLVGLRAIRQELRAMVEDTEFDQKRAGK